MLKTTVTTGPLGADAVRELWCWLWAGIAERECRIWRELMSSRDIRKEKMACLEVRDALVGSLPSTKVYSTGEGLFTRLGLGMPGESVALLRADLGEQRLQARTEASGKELGGNDADAMDLVLGPFLKRFDELAAPGVTAPARTAGLDLSPAAAYEFLAWLGCAIQTLEVSAEHTRSAAEAEDLAGAEAALRMVQGQWVASLPDDPGCGFHSTWARLKGGLGAERVRPFAGWLVAEADRQATSGGTRAAMLARAHWRLAAMAGLDQEALRSLAPPCPPPWEPPTPLPRAYLAGSTRPEPLFAFTMVEGANEPGRFQVPLHQFLATLVRR